MRLHPHRLERRKNEFFIHTRLRNAVSVYCNRRWEQLPESTVCVSGCYHVMEDVPLYHASSTWECQTNRHFCIVQGVFGTKQCLLTSSGGGVSLCLTITSQWGLLLTLALCMIEPAVRFLLELPLAYKHHPREVLIAIVTSGAHMQYHETILYRCRPSHTIWRGICIRNLRQSCNFSSNILRQCWW